MCGALWGNGNLIAPAVPATRDADDITDHELVARIRSGDDRAFECLYRRYHRRIASYIQGMVHDHARAEDIAQDVFMSALRRMRDTDRPIAFKPWIYEIAKNACIDQFRRSRRAEEVSYDADEGLGSADYGRLVTKDPSPEVRYDQKQQLDHLRGAFGGLSETHHEILVMRELEGLSYREIGERLGMTRPAVESTLFRARRRLTEEYEELVTGERCQRVQGIIAAAGSGALGARDRKRVARHVSYCQPCLRHARVSGMDASDLVAKPMRAKIAAFLPLPAFLKAKLGADDGGVRDMAGLGSWSAQMGAVDPNVVTSWGKAAATAATIAIAGVGAGVATNPPQSVRDAFDGGAITDGLGGGDRERSAALTSVSGSGATEPARSRGSRADRRTADRSRSGRRSGDPSRSVSSTGGRRDVGAGATTSTGGAPNASSPSDPAGGSGDRSKAGGGDPVGDTLSRLGDGSAAGGTASGTAGGSAPARPQAPGAPSVEAPKVGVPPVGGGDTGTAGGGAVGDVVEGATGAVEGTKGILGGP